MDKKVKKIIDENKHNQNLKKYSDKHFFKDHSLYRQIRNREDVEQALNFLENTISMYEEEYPLVNDDILAIEKALGKYEIAVRKVLQCYESFGYDSVDLTEMLSNITIYEDRLKTIQLRKMCQD